MEFQQSAWDLWIGKKVFKTSDKPFKSGFKIATVVGVTTNPWTQRQAFTFKEDDSIVECRMCELCGEH